MFGDRYWPAVYFGNRYFAPGTDAAQPQPAAVPTAPTGGIGHGGKKRRKILLPNGRVVTPRSDAEFRDIIEGILARPEPLVVPGIQIPKKLARAKQKAPAAVTTAPRPAYVPDDFLAQLETQRAASLQYAAILKAWQAYWQAMQDDEEEIELLLAG